MRRAALLLLVVAAPAMATEPIRPVIPTELTGDWRLASLPASLGPEVVHLASMRIWPDGYLEADSGCNEIQGWLEIHPPAEYATGVSVTSRVCDGAVMSVEYLFLQALAKAQDYDATPDSLMLRTAAGEPLAYFLRTIPE